MYSVMTTVITATVNCPQLDFELLEGRPTPPQPCYLQADTQRSPTQSSLVLARDFWALLGKRQGLLRERLQGPTCTHTCSLHSPGAAGARWARCKALTPAWWRVGCPHCRPKDMTDCPQPTGQAARTPSKPCWTRRLRTPWLLPAGEAALARPPANTEGTATALVLRLGGKLSSSYFTALILSFVRIS